MVANICENLRLAAKELGAEADIPRLAALKAAALALCPEADEAEKASDDGAAEAGGDTRMEVPGSSPGMTGDDGPGSESGAGGDPPPEKPPD